MKITEYRVKRSFDLHGHDFYEMELILEGSGVQQLNEKKLPLEPGSLFLLAYLSYAMHLAGVGVFRKMKGSNMLAGIDIDGTKCAVAPVAARPEGTVEILGKRKIPTPRESEAVMPFAVKHSPNRWKFAGSSPARFGERIGDYAGLSVALLLEGCGLLTGLLYRLLFEIMDDFRQCLTPRAESKSACRRN